MGQDEGSSSVKGWSCPGCRGDGRSCFQGPLATLQATAADPDAAQLLGCVPYLSIQVLVHLYW